MFQNKTDIPASLFINIANILIEQLIWARGNVSTNHITNIYYNNETSAHESNIYLILLQGNYLSRLFS